MDLRSQRRIASEVLSVGENKVRFDPERLTEVSEAITRDDVRALVKQGVVSAKEAKGNSRGRLRKRISQKRKGRQSGHGKRKGTKDARTSKKERWMKTIRAVRDELRKLKTEGVIDGSAYRNLYLKAKGGLFHSRRHLREQVEKMK